MSITRSGTIVGSLVVVMAGISSGCPVDEIPGCPGRCFEYTVEYETPKECRKATGETIDLPFNGTDPDGYHGRHCFNATTVPQVIAAIEHLRAGGVLTDPRAVRGRPSQP